MSQTLTQSQFITVVSQTTPGTLNLWYTYETPLQVLGLTIPVVDDNNINRQIELLQCTSLTFTVENQLFTVNIQNPQLVTGTGGIQFIFFETTEPIVITSTISESIYTDVPIYISPGNLTFSFQNSEYDVLMNNVQAGRNSIYIQQSDRYKINEQEILAPLNINQIRGNTALKASIQDSNYEISGWKEGRYEGTKSNRYNYSGIEGVVEGITVQAITFNTDISINLLRQQLSGSTFEFTPYFLGGDVTLNPRLVGKFTGYQLLTSSSKTEYTVEVDTSYQGIIRPPATGDIVTFTAGTIKTDIPQDRCRILDTEELTETTIKISTTPLTGSYTSLTPLRIANTSQFYRIAGNTLQPISNQYVLIEQGDELYEVDESGYVIARTQL